MNIGGISWVGSWSINGYISNVRLSNTVRTIAVPTTPYTTDGNTLFLGSQSNRFSDNSSYAASVTLQGSPSVQRFSPFSPTTAYSASTIGGSAYFDGSSANIITTNTITTIGTQDFCLEAWVYCFSTTDYACIIGNDTAGGGNGWFIEMGTARGIFIAGPEVSLGSAQYNRWFHVVFCRVSGTYGGFVNGVRQATGTFTNNYSTAVKIGINSYVVGTLNKGTTGYIADGRVTVGSSPYSPSSSTLTVPTAPLTAVTGTVYLSSMTNAGIFDNAMMNDLETVGNAQISTSVKKYGTGSMYFDGSGDYLLLPNTPLLDQVGDYTYECWYYRAGAGAGGLDILCLKNITNMLYLYVDQSSQKFGINQHNVGGFLTGTTVTAVNTWYHVAMCRSGSTVRLFVNGIQEASGTYSTNVTGTATTTIGGFTSSGYSMNGYLDDLRITKAARYTANFQPPTSQVQDQ